MPSLCDSKSLDCLYSFQYKETEAGSQVKKKRKRAYNLSPTPAAPDRSFCRRPQTEIEKVFKNMEMKHIAKNNIWQNNQKPLQQIEQI